MRNLVLIVDGIQLSPIETSLTDAAVHDAFVKYNRQHTDCLRQHTTNAFVDWLCNEHPTLCRRSWPVDTFVLR